MVCGMAPLYLPRPKPFFMRILPFSAAAGLVLLSSLFPGCQKEQGTFFADPDLTPYYIRQIAVVGGAGAPDTNDTLVYTFTYNRLGEPLTVRHPQVATGNPNAAFLYDNHGRLSAFVQPYDNGGYETYVKYFYNDRNEIASDSQYIFGSYIDSVPIANLEFGVTRHWYKYDDQGRIIQRIDSFYQGAIRFGSGASFTYDGKGDLINGATYDNRVSYRRTNVIWMFLSNDYSVHNAFQADSYNVFGLPLAFDGNDPIGRVVTDAGTIILTYSRL
jgi:hypothetical protein